MSWQPPERTLADVRAKPRRARQNANAAFRRELTNLPIRVPGIDWERVIGGEKPMFRCYSDNPTRRQDPIVPAAMVLPRPVIAFTQRNDRARTRSAALMILEEARQEPLASISPADLATEGFEFLGQFRWYWKRRHVSLGWRPWDMINVMMMRPPVPDDWAWCGEWAMKTLYGEWL